MTREEAINKLEYLINSPVGREEIDETCYEVMKYLSMQKPRLLTLEEVLALNPDTPIYFQHKSGESGWDIYRGIEDDITCDIVTGSLWAQGDYWYQNEYGKSFVCWTSRPTAAEMEATPWN